MLRSESGTEWRASYTRFDFRFAKELVGGFEAVAGIDNLFHEQVADWPGFTGRHLYTTLAWRAGR